jgi:hypothetical protein
MAYQQLREVLANLRRAHNEAGACCAEVADARDERLTLRADFFRKREEALASRLESFEDGKHKRVLDTWVQYVPSREVEASLEGLRAARDRGSGAVLAECGELQRAIVGFLRQLAKNLEAPNVREILQDLAVAEEGALKELSMAELTEREA